MEYISRTDYNDLLKKFAQGSTKQTLQENYIDLRPINSLQEEAEVVNPGKYAGGPRSHFDKDGDGVPDGADKNPTDGSKKEEGLYGDGPMLTGPTGYKLENLTIEERKELKSYAQSMKTTRKAIEELLEKAKMRTEGGNMSSGLTMHTGE